MTHRSRRNRKEIRTIQKKMVTSCQQDGRLTYPILMTADLMNDD